MQNLSVPLAMAAGFYLLVVVGMFVFQRSFLYYPDRQAPDLADAGGEALEVVHTRSADGLELVHWYRPPASPGGPVVVVFHGNAGHAVDRVAKLRAMLEAGFGVFFAEYRGYGGNPGQPDEPGLTADARAVMALLEARGVGLERIILYGESLGTGVAVKMAVEHPVAGLVLEAPFTSIADVAQAHYWYLPARWLLHDKWESLGRIRGVASPILVVHGERDRVIPTRFGRRLFEAAPEPKTALYLPSAGHNDVWNYPEARRAILDFVRAQVPGAPAPAE